MVIFGRSHIEQIFPYFDYDLVDFVLSLPVSFRNKQLLFRAVIRKEIPELANIPCDHDELPPTTNNWIRNYYYWIKRLQKAFNHHIQPIFPEYATLYADYEKYLRHELRPWAEEIIHGPGVIEHGLFRPSFLKLFRPAFFRKRDLDHRENCPDLNL